MLDTWQTYLATGVLVLAIYFSLSAAARLFNLFLRYIDHLSIDREDVLALLHNLRNALVSFLIAYIAYRTPLPMTLALLGLLLLAWQLVRADRVLRRLQCGQADRRNGPFSSN